MLLIGRRVSNWKILIVFTFCFIFMYKSNYLFSFHNFIDVDIVVKQKLFKKQKKKKKESKLFFSFSIYPLVTEIELPWLVAGPLPGVKLNPLLYAILIDCPFGKLYVWPPAIEAAPWNLNTTHNVYTYSIYSLDLHIWQIRWKTNSKKCID